MGGNIPGGNFLGGNFPGGIFQGGVWWVVIFPGGIFLEPDSRCIYTILIIFCMRIFDLNIFITVLLFRISKAFFKKN